MNEIIDQMKHHTDLFPWYWYSYGEKCYAFAVVEAFPEEGGQPYPEPGTQLSPDQEDVRVWIGENGTRMLIENEIASIERQNGHIICQFIAEAHAHLLKDALAETIAAESTAN